MHTLFLRVGLIALLFLGLNLGEVSGTFAAPAANAQITIHPNRTIAQVTPYHLGSNVAMWLGDNLYDETLRARTRASGIQYLRIPGGSASDEYGWLSCELRENQEDAFPCVADGWQEWAARPTEFINFIRATNIQNVIYTMNVNVTPQEAAAAVAFFNARPNNNTVIGIDANGFDWKTAGYWADLRVDHGNTQPLGIKHWEIGNETYGGSPAAGGSDCQWWGWENAWTCDGAEYVNGARGHAGYAAMRTAMRAIDSSISVGAVGFETPGDYNNWTNEVVANAGSFMDFIVVHPYAYDNPPANSYGGWADVMAMPRIDIPNIKTELQGVFDEHASGRSIPIAANEYNIPSTQDSDGEQMMNRAGNAFFITEMIGQLIENGFTAANQWDLTNGCAGNGACYDLLQVDNNWKRSPQYYAFPLWSRFGSTMLGVTNNRNPRTKLSVYAGKIDADTYSVLVLNKTGKVFNTRIAFDTGLQVTSGIADVFKTRSPMAKKIKWNGKANPSDDLSDAPPSALTNVGTTTRYSFQPYSITLLRLNVE